MSNKVPLITVDVVTYVNLGFLGIEVNVQFESVVCPGAELHVARLFVERKIGDVYGAAGHVDCRGNPQHLTVVFDDHHRVALFFQAFVGTTASHVYTIIVIIVIIIINSLSS